MKNWSFHSCILDSDCRRYGAPKRFNFVTPWGGWDVALSPGSRFAGRMLEPWWSEFKKIPSGRDPELVARRRAIFDSAEYGKSRWVSRIPKRTRQG